jgi:hypothetical protein
MSGNNRCYLLLEHCAHELQKGLQREQELLVFVSQHVRGHSL